MTFVGNMLSLAKGAVAKWKSVHGSESLDQQCQRYSGYYVSWVYQGNESIVGYASAKLAAQASAIGGKSVNSAPFGSYLYWQIGTYWHVMNALGMDGKRVICAGATTKGDKIADLGNGVKSMHADSYGPATGAVFYGWSMKNGANKPLTGVTAYNTGAPTMTPTQRQVLATGDCNQRPSPSTINNVVGEYKASTIVDMEAYCAGQIPSGKTSNVWFKPKGKAAWCHAQGFTSVSTANIPRWPSPPMRQVVDSTKTQATYKSNGVPLLALPEKGAAVKSNLSAWAPVTPIGYSLVTVEGQPDPTLWYVFNTVAEPWYGLGTDYTESAIHDLTNLTPKPPDPTPGDGTLTPETIVEIARAVAAILHPEFALLHEEHVQLLDAIENIPGSNPGDGGTFRVTVTEPFTATLDPLNG